jgi:Clustered mitochondria
MSEICQKIGLKVASVKEATGNVKQIAGSPEIKGVRGTDRRKYLIDLMRSQPRDVNFPNPVSHASCLVRDEAFKIFNL